MRKVFYSIVLCFPTFSCVTQKYYERPVEVHTVNLYHATDSKNEESILKHGFKTDQGGSGAGKGAEHFEKQSKGKIHLTANYRIALDYAHFLFCRKKQKPVIFAIKFPESEFEKLLKDIHDGDALVVKEDITPDRVKVITKDSKITKEDCQNLFRDISFEKFTLEFGTTSEFKGCVEKFHGKLYGPHKEFCLVDKYYYTLHNQSLNGIDKAPFHECEKDFKGISYGSQDEYCAVQNYLVTLGKEDNFRKVEPKEFENCKSKFHGIAFGPHKEFCAVHQSTRVLENINSDKTFKEFKDCESQFGGKVYGPHNEYCAVIKEKVSFDWE